MSSFLKRLISGDSSVDNNSAPDAHGVITRRLIKDHVRQLPEDLGLTLSDDAEVTHVAASSLAEAANIPSQFMIFEVNNTFVADSTSFFECCRSSLTLTIKLQSVSGMSEIIARIMGSEEQFSGEELQRHLRLDELLQTTPRFNFLSTEHPLFRRYMKRLQDKREAQALIRQRLEELKAQEQREILEKVKRAREENLSKTSERTAQKTKVETPTIKLEEVKPFLEMHEENSCIFSKVKVMTNSTGEKSEVMNLSANLDTQLVLDDPNTAAQELYALVGLSAPLIGKGKISYVVLPSEEYVLSSGEKVIHSLKKRCGPLPTPPP